MQGEPLRLACCGPTAGTTEPYRWFMDGASNGSANGSTNGSANGTTRPEYTGQVWSRHEAPAHASGTYFCQVQTAEGPRNSAKLTIDVQCE